MKRLDYDGQPFCTKGVFYKISFSYFERYFWLNSFPYFLLLFRDKCCFIWLTSHHSSLGSKVPSSKGFSLTTPPNIRLPAPLPWNPVPYVQPWPCLLSFYHPMRLYFHHCWHDTYLFVVCLPLLEHKHAESRSMPVYLHWYLSRWGHITQQVLSKCTEWMKKWMNESEVLNYMVLIEHKKIGLEN